MYFLTFFVWKSSILMRRPELSIINLITLSETAFYTIFIITWTKGPADLEDLLNPQGK